MERSMKGNINSILSKVEAFIFDMDGVLFDTERVYLDVWSEVFQKYGYNMTKEVYVSVMGTGRENVKSTFLKIYGDDLPIEQMYKEKDEELNKIIDEGKIPMKDGAYEVLEFLKEKGYKIALATSAKSDRVSKHLKQANIEAFFDVVVTGDQVLKAKPDPEIFIKASHNLNIPPQRCIVIEDSEAGIEAAFKGQFFSIHAKDLKESDDNIMKKCWFSLKSIIHLKHILEN